MPTARKMMPTAAVRWSVSRSTVAREAGERPVPSRCQAVQWSQPAIANGMATSGGPTTSSRRAEVPEPSLTPSARRPSSASDEATEMPTYDRATRMTAPK